MRKIAITHPIDQMYIDRIREAAPGWEIIAGKKTEGFDRHVAEAEIIAGWSGIVEREALKPGTKLRWLQNWSAGVDRMPLKKFEELGIVLTSASGVHPNPISETIFAMILGFTRQIHQAVRHQQSRTWGQYGAMSEIHGKTIGIVGTGAIGLETARIAKAFRMQTLGVRRSAQSEPDIDEMYGLDKLCEVLSRSDYIVNCLPYTTDSHYLFGEREFRSVKQGAFYINIGRGKTTDTAALLEALRDGRLSGAGLDVFEQEPLPEDHPFWAMDNVIMTPHNAGSTTEYTARVTEIFIANLKQYMSGELPTRNVVSFRDGY